MTERPILFSAPMIRSLLAGQKSQTRRLAKLPDWWPRSTASAVLGPGPQYWPHDARGRRVGHAGLPSRQCRYGGAGDRLWVRETWAAHWMYNDVPPRECKSMHPGDNYWFAADGTDAPSQLGTLPQGLRGRNRPGIHMPRWASRITLEVTQVRLERLQSISEADARAEGVEFVPLARGAHAVVSGPTPVGFFAMLWNQIHGEGAWARNPWVWVVGFRRVA